VLVCSLVLGLRCIVNVFFSWKDDALSINVFFSWNDGALSKLKGLWIRLGHFGVGEKISLFPYQSK
jgi:hypothetical protein